jgi:5-methylcytosine-specific restriction protein A
MCEARGVTTVATVADHIVPHRFDYHAFWNGALQSLCKPCHDTIKQKDERRGYSLAPDDDGWPMDLNHPFNRKAQGLPALPRARR